MVAMAANWLSIEDDVKIYATGPDLSVALEWKLIE